MPAAHLRRVQPRRASVRRVLAGALTALAAAAGLSLAPLPALAQAAAPAAASGAAAAQPLCGKPAPGDFTCFSLRRTNVRHGLGVQAGGSGRAAAPAGYSPAGLRSAYRLPSGGGAGATIAVVDAYDDPSAEQDMAVYREQYGLPACTTADGCFRKVDERGGTDYPGPDLGWAGEISLDLDMISAVAPKARIILVEADTPQPSDLGIAENMAVSLGAQYVSNSWGGYEDTASDLAENTAYFDHPGTALVFASGDYGYGVTYPAASPYVTSVGGTSLTRDASTARGWQETVWNSAAQDPDGLWDWGAPASGCSTVEPKPSWQADAGCAGRSVTDVSAVADPATGVAVYDTQPGSDGWNEYGGTSVAAPIITGIYALAGQPVAGTYPASYLYHKPGALNDVTSGDNDSCSAQVDCGLGTAPDCTPSYECQAGPGYDGPTGLGTPDGLAAFKPGPHGVISGTVTDSSTGRPLAGATVTLGSYQATTGSDGSYRLDVPAGSYQPAVSDFGYTSRDLPAIRVASGATATGSAALAPVPSTTLTGTIRDGGGHGWGLYAQITVDGFPGTAYTDPATGRYSLRLPRGSTYTLTATALYPGYQQISVPVTAGGPTASMSLALPVDADAGTLPPGYDINYGGGEDQTFDNASVPAGWTVKNNNGNGGWNFTDPLNRGNQTGGTGHFAEVDDFAQGWEPLDTELISPAYNFTSDPSPELDFDTAEPAQYRLSDMTTDVDVSTDGGTTWTNVWEDTSEIDGPAHESVSLAAYGGQPSVQIRFHYTGDSLTGIWEVDNVQIGSHTLEELPGGLLTGQVRDANTGTGVAGATVSPAASPDDTAVSVATPGDPARGDGLYWLFSPGTGSQQFTAGLPSFGYPTVTTTAKVTADAVTTANITLHPAQLQFSRPAAGASLAWGTTKTVTVQLRNTGGSPATVSLGADAGAASGGAGRGPAAGGLAAAGGLVTDGPAATGVQEEAATQTPMDIQDEPAQAPDPTDSTVTDSTATGAAGTAWQRLGNQPLPNYGGVAAVINGTLYAGLGEAPGGSWSTAFYSYDAAANKWTALASAVTGRYAPAWGVIDGKLYVTGGKDSAGNPIPGGEVYDPASNAWSQIASAPLAYGGAGSAVASGQLYVIGGCDFSDCGYSSVEVYDPKTNTWAAGPRYPEPVAFPSCGTINSVIYCAGGAYEQDDDDTDTAAGYKLEPGSTIWQPIADAPTDFWGATSTAASGLLLSAGGQSMDQEVDTSAAYAYDPATNTWSAQPSLPSPLMNAASAPGWYAIGGTNANGAFLASVLQLPGLSQPHAGVPWLSAAPSTVTVGARQSVTIRLTLDASSMGPADLGSHEATLFADADTPYGSASLPVSLTVTPPAGWGQVAGTVTTDQDGTRSPVAGAAVDIAGSAGDTTVQTAADGSYSAWLPASDNPLAISVTAPGYTAATVPAAIRAGRTVRVSVSLTAG